MFAAALNLALARHLPADVRNMLQGRKLRLRVTDARCSFDFVWTPRQFVACVNPGDADLTVSASAHDFLLLARGQEDPDTLFFNRRLSMEGDTELGLLVKNSLDAMELPVVDLSQFSPARVLARIKARLVPR
jgi:predicted lipid carrier protein YhbT